MTAAAPLIGQAAPGAPDAVLSPDTGRMLRPLALFGQPVLHARAEQVTVFDEALAALVEDMFATMSAAPGVGLAATQVGVGLRVFTYDCGPGKKGHICNPVIENLEGGLQEPEEGCLSVPGLYYETVRSLNTRATGVDCDGNPVEVEGTGLLAQCLQHETDHLDGRLYLDRLGGKIRRQAMREVREAEWHGQHWKLLTPKPPREGEPSTSVAERITD